MPEGWPDILALDPSAEIEKVVDNSGDHGMSQAVTARQDGIGQNIFATFEHALSSTGYDLSRRQTARADGAIEWTVTASKGGHQVIVHVRDSGSGPVEIRLVHRSTADPGD